MECQNNSWNSNSSLEKSEELTREKFMSCVKEAFPCLPLATKCIEVDEGKGFAILNDRHGVTLRVANLKNPRWFLAFHFDDMFVQISCDSLSGLRNRLENRLSHFEEHLEILRKVFGKNL